MIRVRSIDTSVLCFTALALGLFTTRPVAADQPPDDPTDVNQEPLEHEDGNGVTGGIDLPGCAPILVTQCEDIGGEAVVLSYSEAMEAGVDCACDVLLSEGPRIVNARRGDVGLVPIGNANGDLGGDENVRAVIAAIGQWHRHTVIYSDAGTQVTHLTTYNRPTTGNLVVRPSIVPPLLRLIVNPYLMEHGALPGTTFGTQEVMQPLANALSETDPDRSRMVRAGLVLKPRDESLRADFEAAASRAEGISAFYRVSDYSAMNGMALPLTGGDHNRGTHCSGFVEAAFAPAFPISQANYSAATRLAAGNELYDTVRNSLPWVASATSVRRDIANQAVNCFAGNGCDNFDPNWAATLTAGRSIAPDNLLPTSFQVTNVSDVPEWSPICASPFVNCSSAAEANTVLAGSFSVTETSENSDAVENPNGAARTPFQRIEPQVFADGSVRTVRLYRW